METEFIHLSDRYLYAKSSSNTIDMINRTNFKKIHSLKALRPKCILEVERPVDDLEIYSASIFIGCWDSIVEVINFKIIRKKVAKLEEDRLLKEDINAIIQLVKTKQIVVKFKQLLTIIRRQKYLKQRDTQSFF